MTRTDLTVGATFEVWWPFRMQEVGAVDVDGFRKEPDRIIWHPGWDAECGGAYGEAWDFCWNGEGAQVRTSVSIHSPGETYQPRIFFKRQWKAPDGTASRPGPLIVETEGRFLRWLTGKSLAFLSENRGHDDVVATIWPADAP